MALRIPAGAARSFALEKLGNFDAELWHAVVSTAAARRLPVVPLSLFGADLYGDQLKLARENLAAAGVESAVTLKQANVLELPAPCEPGVLVTNPPYGVRLGEQQELAHMYPKLGDALKQKYAGWRVCIFTADLRLPKLIGLKPARRIPLYNGALECRLYVFEMVSGSMRRQTTSRDE